MVVFFVCFYDTLTFRKWILLSIRRVNDPAKWEKLQDSGIDKNMCWQFSRYILIEICSVLVVFIKRISVSAEKPSGTYKYNISKEYEINFPIKEKSVLRLYTSDGDMDMDYGEYFYFSDMSQRKSCASLNGMLD